MGKKDLYYKTASLLFNIDQVLTLGSVPEVYHVQRLCRCPGQEHPRSARKSPGADRIEL
jgi:hypothetical protein